MVKGVLLIMDQYSEFMANIKELCRLDLNLYKEKQMKRRIKSLIKKNGLGDFNSYFNLLRRSSRHMQEFLGYITINVSEFFRNPQQWQLLEKEIIPELISKKDCLNIWSCACASGEEPYSIALLLMKIHLFEKVHILATDIDSDAINDAKTGIYHQKSLVNIPGDLLKLYFIDKGNGFFEIKETIRKKVSFKCLNLLEDDFPNNMDLIICRNVLIYFTEKAKEKLYPKFFKSLVNNGILFVGSTEQIIMPQKYGFLSTKSFFYKKTAYEKK